MRTSLRPCAALSLLAALAAPVSAQTVEEIVDRMYAAVERQAAGIDDYTLYQTAMGFETTTYMVKETVDGRTFFVPRQAGAAGASAEVGAFSDLGEFGPQLIEHGRYDGREEVEGAAVHVIAIDDLSRIDLPTPSAPGEMEFEPRSGRLYLDAERYVPLRMAFDGVATTPTGTHEVTTRVDMTDYREVEGGLLVPFRTVISVEGLEAMIDPEMRAQYEEMKRQLEELPEAQRAMFQQMMGAQMQSIEQMMQGEGGTMTFEVTVNEVRVNAGPPSDS